MLRGNTNNTVYIYCSFCNSESPKELTSLYLLCFLQFGDPKMAQQPIFAAFCNLESHKKQNYIYIYIYLSIYIYIYIFHLCCCLGCRNLSCMRPRRQTVACAHTRDAPKYIYIYIYIRGCCHLQMTYYNIFNIMLYYIRSKWQARRAGSSQMGPKAVGAFCLKSDLFNRWLHCAAAATFTSRGCRYPLR